MSRIKVVLAKVSMDGHDRGVKVLARLLRDSGMEVIYLGKFLSHEVVIEAVAQEHAQVVGLSFLSGEHLAHTRRFAKALRSRGLRDVLFLVGGVIPRQDFPQLLEAGADGVFVAGTPVEEVVAFIRERVRGAEVGDHVERGVSHEAHRTGEGEDALRGAGPAGPGTEGRGKADRRVHVLLRAARDP